LHELVTPTPHYLRVSILTLCSGTKLMIFSIQGGCYGIFR
jgi:hypothetical protein